MGTRNAVATSWRADLSVGLTDVDADHKALFSLVGAMARVIERRDEAAVSMALQTLVGGCSDHFTREERILDTRNDPRLASHRTSHNDMLERFILLRHRFVAAENPEKKWAIAKDTHEALVQWLEHHILTEDMVLLTPPQAAVVPPSSAGAPPSRVVSALPRPPAGVLSPSPVPSASGSGRQSAPPRPDSDVDYALPPHLAHLLRRIECHIPRLERAGEHFQSFEQLCAAAVRRRIDTVLIFFQRTSPDVSRALEQPFITSADFAERFGQAVERLILPTMMQSRQLRQLATHMDWRRATAESFWDAVDRPLAEDMLARWRAAWDELLLVERVKDDGSRVFQVKPATKILRQMLIPTELPAYDLPRIGNVEMRAFRSLFNPLRDLTVGLEAAWRACHDLYEQELDPRVFQQQARDGALRDYFLSIHGEFSDHWGEFLILACHRCFRRVTIRYIERFSLSLGPTSEERAEHMPFLMSYLSQLDGRSHIRHAERDDEDRWHAERRDLKKVLRGAFPAAC